MSKTKDNGGMGEIAKMIGLTCLWKAALSVRVRVTIKDVRRAFGRVDLLVTPLEGDGELWIDQEKVEWTGRIVP